jgi:hypothetical protein
MDFSDNRWEVLYLYNVVNKESEKHRYHFVGYTTLFTLFSLLKTPRISAPHLVQSLFQVSLFMLQFIPLAAESSSSKTGNSGCKKLGKMGEKQHHKRIDKFNPYNE